MTTDLTEIVVIGADDTGLVAGVTTLLFERGINIEDIDQAVHESVFRMRMHVDTSEMSCTREELEMALYELGRDLDVDVKVRFPSDRRRRHIAVLVTQESHCLETLLDADANGELDAEVSVVVGNYDDLADVAAEYDVPFHNVGNESGTPDERELLDLLSEYDVDVVALARYMRILSPEVVVRYEHRIINVHPSLLPSVPGAQAYRQAREEGVRVAGVTAHYVTTDLDQGPIITQRAFDVPDGATVDEIQRRGQPLEAEALVEAVKLHLDDALQVHHGRTELRRADESYQLGLTPEMQAANPTKPIDRSLDVAEDARETEADATSDD